MVLKTFDIFQIIQNWSSFENIQVVESDAFRLTEIIQKLEQNIFNIEKPFSKGFLKDASYIFDLLEKVQVKINNSIILIGIFNELNIFF